MSKEGVVSFIEMTLNDGIFLTRWAADPEGVLSQFDLTDWEKAAIKSGGEGGNKGRVGYWEKALSIYPTLEGAKKAAEVHLGLAQQYAFNEVDALDMDKAYWHCRRAIELMGPSRESPQLAQAYARLGLYTAASHLEPVSAAIAHVERGLAVAQRLRDAAVITEAETSLANLLAFLAGDADRALQLYRQSYESAMKSSDSLAVSRAATQLAFFYATFRDADRALLWAQQAVEASGQAASYRNQALSALLLAWAVMLRGDATGALSSLDSAELVARKGGAPVTQWTHGAIITPGLVHFFIGDWDKAEAELLDCLKTARRTHHLLVALTWVSPALGWLYLERDDLTNAKTYLEEAITVSHTGGYKTAEVSLSALLAHVASREGEPDAAAEHLRRAKEIISNGQDWSGLAAEVHMAEGVLATARKHWQEAEAAFQKAVETNRQYQLPYYEARSLLEWGEMYLSRNDPEDRNKGMQFLDQALAIFQRIRARKMVEKVRARRAR